jgi:hypothetical protein
VKDRKLLRGASPLFSAGSVTKLKQKSLFACEKSYVARSTAASLPGLRDVNCGCRKAIP